MVSERQWTRRLPQLFPQSGDEIVGLGDDGAVVPLRGKNSVLCCDPVIENVHFTANQSPGLVGRKAVNRNLSDLAAMGAIPDWLLVSLVLPKGYPASRRRLLIQGIQRAAERAGCSVVGGDVAVHAGPLIVTVTAMGHTAGQPLLRSDARPGDTLHVSGPLGGAQCGEGHLRFEPAVKLGPFLSRQKSVGACIDVSDGLVLDLATVLSASGGLGATLDGDALPLRRAAHRAAAASGRSPLDHALTDGEDHVLLFTMRPGAAGLPAHKDVPAVARRPIGSIQRAPGLHIRQGDDVRLIKAAQGGYQHAL